MGLTDIFAKRKEEPPYRAIGLSDGMACGHCGTTPLLGTWDGTGRMAEVFMGDIGGVGLRSFPTDTQFPAELDAAFESGVGLPTVGCVACGHRLMTPKGGE